MQYIIIKEYNFTRTQYAFILNALGYSTLQVSINIGSDYNVKLITAKLKLIIPYKTLFSFQRGMKQRKYLLQFRSWYRHNPADSHIRKWIQTPYKLHHSGRGRGRTG